MHVRPARLCTAHLEEDGAVNTEDIVIKAVLFGCAATVLAIVFPALIRLLGRF